MFSIFLECLLLRYINDHKLLFSTTLEYIMLWGMEGIPGIQECYFPMQFMLSIMFHCSCCCLVIKSYPTPCDAMGCSLPGSSVQGILQARILEWDAISFSRGSSWHGDQTRVSCSQILYHWVTREAHNALLCTVNLTLAFSKLITNQRELLMNKVNILPIF